MGRNLAVAVCFVLPFRSAQAGGVERHATRAFIPSIVGAVVALTVFGAATICQAGSICGTVRDGQTLQPVPQAAVFLFDSEDAYTGRYAGTDNAGHYCIDDVAAGTYTIQVRVDDYVAAVVRNVVVDETSTGVDVTTRPPLFLHQPWPNPATSAVTFRFNTPDDAQATLEVFDVAGRLVMGWKGSATGGRDVYWDLRDARGNAVPSGIYLVRLRAGGQETVRRFVRVR